MYHMDSLQVKYVETGLTNRGLVINQNPLGIDLSLCVSYWLSFGRWKPKHFRCNYSLVPKGVITQPLIQTIFTASGTNTCD